MVVDVVLVASGVGLDLEEDGDGDVRDSGGSPLLSFRTSGSSTGAAAVSSSWTITPVVLTTSPCAWSWDVTAAFAVVCMRGRLRRGGCIQLASIRASASASASGPSEFSTWYESAAALQQHVAQCGPDRETTIWLTTHFGKWNAKCIRGIGGIHISLVQHTVPESFRSLVVVWPRTTCWISSGIILSLLITPLMHTGRLNEGSNAGQVVSCNWIARRSRESMGFSAENHYTKTRLGFTPDGRRSLHDAVLLAGLPKKSCFSW